VQINVRRGGFGPMEGAVVALGIGTGLLGVLEAAFRPFAAGSIVLGAVVAAILVWRRRHESHPSISRHARSETDAHQGIEPK
jgi:hypothetical protein